MRASAASASSAAPLASIVIAGLVAVAPPAAARTCACCHRTRRSRRRSSATADTRPTGSARTAAGGTLQADVPGRLDRACRRISTARTCPTKRARSRRTAAIDFDGTTVALDDAGRTAAPFVLRDTPRADVTAHGRGQGREWRRHHELHGRHRPADLDGVALVVIYANPARPLRHDRAARRRFEHRRATPSTFNFARTARHDRRRGSTRRLVARQQLQLAGHRRPRVRPASAILDGRRQRRAGSRAARATTTTVRATTAR